MTSLTKKAHQAGHTIPSLERLKAAGKPLSSNREADSRTARWHCTHCRPKPHLQQPPPESTLPRQCLHGGNGTHGAAAAQSGRILGFQPGEETWVGRKGTTTPPPRRKRRPRPMALPGRTSRPGVSPGPDLHHQPQTPPDPATSRRKTGREGREKRRGDKPPDLARKEASTLQPSGADPPPPP